MPLERTDALPLWRTTVDRTCPYVHHNCLSKGPLCILTYSYVPISLRP